MSNTPSNVEFNITNAGGAIHSMFNAIADDKAASTAETQAAVVSATNDCNQALVDLVGSVYYALNQ